MGKVKVKKQSTFVDMTAMSDVTVLLLTFFMLTATFMPKEPVQVDTPRSVSEKKVPEFNSLNILVDLKGKVYMALDKPEDKQKVLMKMAERYGIKNLTQSQVKAFEEQTHVGVPMNRLTNFLKLPTVQDRDAEIKSDKNVGIPHDSTDNQLAEWVKTAMEINPDLVISIKADQKTPYPFVEKVMKTLSEVKQSRYTLVTNLRAMPEGL